MDALAVLKSDHDKVRKLFMEFRAAAEAKDNEKLADVTAKIFDELETHTVIEERVFYPEVKKAGGAELEDLTAESNEEHHVVDVHHELRIRVLVVGEPDAHIVEDGDLRVGSARAYRMSRSRV